MFSRNGRMLWIAAVVAVPVLMQADLPEWVRFVEGGSRLEQALFRAMNLPSGPVLVRRVPKESREQLTQAIAATPNEAELYKTRAHEAELALDFSAAEGDWNKYAALEVNKFAGRMALADFYHRRVRVQDELRLLGEAGKEPQATAAVFERMLQVADRHLLAHEVRRGIFDQYAARFASPALLERRIQAEIGAGNYAAVEPLVAELDKRYPSERDSALRLRAAVEQAKGNVDGALAVYDRGFDIANPPAAYFELLRSTRRMRQFLNEARAAGAKDPLAIGPVARQVHWYLAEGNPPAAQRVLSEYRARKEAKPGLWKAEELLTAAVLWQQYLRNEAEAVRHYYALYSLQGAPAAQQETALAEIASLLLAFTDRRLPLGRGDLSFYRDIATADPYPGFLNGVLSLLLNSSEPGFRFQMRDEQAAPYFSRAKAAELIAVFERRFPQSQRRAGLRFQLLQAYGAHGQDDAVLGGGRQFLTGFSNDGLRSQVTLLMADASARKSLVKEELALYDGLLVELSAASKGQPLGPGVVVGGRQAPKTAGPANAEYARVLDRYLSRLVALKRPKDALLVLRKEIDRNPNDPGLYERLATFLDQNKMAGEIEAVYRKAMAQFADRGWHHKLARFYLRQKRTAQFGQLTAEVTKIFKGTELESYFRDVVSSSSLDVALYRQVNTAAMQRFPYNLTFVRNLVTSYDRPGAANVTAMDDLLRRYWFYDDDLRNRMFARLQQSGQMPAQLTALSKLATADNPGATRMLAEAQAWQSHHEEAGAPLLELAKAVPGDRATGVRAALLQRSLAAFDAKRALDSGAVEANLIEAAPRQTEARVRLGELNREYSIVTAGREVWSKIPEVEPGNSELYVEAATVHWDYFEFDPALRLLESGRTRLKNPRLFAYEAGAIYENKRDYGRAVQEYVKGALDGDGASPSMSRLIRLARRPALRGPIDSATAQLASGPNPDRAAVTLRLKLLEQQQRGADLSAYLTQLASETQSFEMLERVTQEAQRLGFGDVEQRALARQIELMPDPLDKLALRLQQVQLYERQKNTAQAARLMDSLYRENPMTLGIVRAAVNYHWRNQNQGRSLELLEAASRAAHPSLKKQFAFEAARKATDAGQYDVARRLLSGLLGDEPLNASYLGAMADTYARQGDDRGLRAFYQDKITMLAASAMPGAERTARVASMRRALIPVLTRSKDFAGAVDQYIEVINRYPEDAALLDEAAAYARQNGQQAKLSAYYTKASAEAARDARLATILARLHTAFENYPAAIEAYTKASQLRPDRTDLLESRGRLEERLLRFEEAAATYGKLYELTYRNSVWMERVAEVRARQGRTDDAVAALRTAFIEGRESAPAGYFEAARRLEGWRFYQPATELAEKGVALAGAKLVEDHRDGAEIYARLLARARKFEPVLAMAPDGSLLEAMAPVIRAEYSDPEMVKFAAFLDKNQVGTPHLARLANMPSWEARKLNALLLENANKPEAGDYLPRLEQLQRQRLRFADLGAQLEAYAGRLTNADERMNVRGRAAEAYQAAGDEAAEMRLRGTADPRYLRLLARRDPQRLIALGRVDAINAAMESGKPDLVLAALPVAATQQKLTPLWQRAYTGLAGMYFGLKTPDIETAFREALGALTVGEALAKPADRNQQLVSDNWFYYGGRFGEYLDFLGKADSAEFLPAVIEANPGRADAYVQLAEYYGMKNRPAQALEQYELALQLRAANVSALDGAARMLWAQNKREEAKARWVQALRAGSGGSQLRPMLDELASRNLLGELRSEVDAALVRHLRRSGGYDAEQLLRHFDVAYMVGLSRQVPGSIDMVRGLVQAEWIPAGNKEPLYQRWIELAAENRSRAVGEARDQAEAEYWNAQRTWLDHLLRVNPERAQQAYEALGQLGKERLAMEDRIALRLASKRGRLADALQAHPEWTAYFLRDQAAELKTAGDMAGARLVLRLSYERDLASGDLNASAFLGLAEVLLEGGDVEGAMRTLRRMALVTDPPFANLVNAARLLRTHNRTAEADVFLDQAAKAIPWDAELQAMRKPAAAAAAAPTLAHRQAAVWGNPFDNSKKLELFRALHAAGRHQQAVVTMEVLLQGGPMMQVFQDDMGYAGAELRANPYWAESFLQGYELNAGQRAAVGRDLADSLAKTGRPVGALMTLDMAEKIQASAGGAAQVAQLRSTVERLRQNELRKPIVSNNLEQDRLVRPMVGGAQ